MSELYIITGSNGAGKSTTGPKYLPANIIQQGPVFDGDKLFIEKRKELWRTIKSHKECAKLAYEFVTETFDHLVEASLVAHRDFAYEGHFTNEATWDIPRQFLAAGYRVHLLFLGLRDTELSEVRVKERWQSGGHYVDPQTVADNFYGNLKKLNRHYQMFNTVHIIDTSDAEHIVLTIFDKGQPALSIPSKDLPRWFRNDLPDITHKIEEEEVGRELL
ncbi:MAG TPA: zeta toxin family protein [Puia sp.]|jgi:predicted ABC-type ATPase|nr:zeta toxin family protein [Puia sp.]